MSVEILLNSAGRLASLAKNSRLQQGNIAVKATHEGQENSDPVKLFGALVEKPQGKIATKGEEPEEQQPAEGDKTENPAPQHATAYVLPQSFLALATNQPDQTAEDSGPVPVKSKTANTDEIIAEVEPLADDAMPAKNGEPQPKPKVSAAVALNVAMVAKPEAASRHDTPPALNSASPDGVQPDIANLLKADAPASAQPVVDGGEPSRAILQPSQQGARNADLANPGPTSAQPSAPARIADVQIVSERSFGSVKTLQIRLDPVELGSVTARIRLVGDGVEVHLVAEKTHGAEALAADRTVIEKALKSAGIGDEGRISVTVTERGAANPAQYTSASQNAGHQQASGQQPGQQTFNMQDNSGGRNQPQMQFTSGEGGQNGESGHTGRNNAGERLAAEAGERETVAGVTGRNRGIVV
ncbi:flagellar hook-length control protein FliK [Falsochrobactrum shanghaiense]|nr:flagellar hook-length control protein FliK [Falsochrobactrum shanghaiense]